MKDVHCLTERQHAESWEREMLGDVTEYQHIMSSFTEEEEKTTEKKKKKMEKTEKKKNKTKKKKTENK